MATDHDRLARALAGADYPADKQDLQDLARQNGADDATLKALRSLQPVSYETFNDVVRSAPMDAAAEEGQTDRDKAKQDRSSTKGGLSEQMTRTSNNPIEEELGANPKKGSREG